MYDLKIFTDLIEPSAINQIYEMIAKPPFEGAKVRIMPDAHSGAGCVVGFTSTMTDKSAWTSAAVCLPLISAI